MCTFVAFLNILYLFFISFHLECNLFVERRGKGPEERGKIAGIQPESFQPRPYKPINYVSN